MNLEQSNHLKAQLERCLDDAMRSASTCGVEIEAFWMHLINARMEQVKAEAADKALVSLGSYVTSQISENYNKITKKQAAPEAVKIGITERLFSVNEWMKSSGKFSRHQKSRHANIGQLAARFCDAKSIPYTPSGYRMKDGAMRNVVGEYPAGILQQAYDHHVSL